MREVGQLRRWRDSRLCFSGGLGVLGGGGGVYGKESLFVDQRFRCLFKLVYLGGFFFRQDFRVQRERRSARQFIFLFVFLGFQGVFKRLGYRKRVLYCCLRFREGSRYLLIVNIIGSLRGNIYKGRQSFFLRWGRRNGFGNSSFVYLIFLFKKLNFQNNILKILVFFAKGVRCVSRRVLGFCGWGFRQQFFLFCFW